MKCAFLVSLALAASAPSLACAQQVDMATLQKWASAKVAHFEVEGAYSAWTPVSQQWKMAEGDVTDSLTLAFDLDIATLSVIGDIAFQDGTSTVKSMRSAQKDCPVAKLAGTYEHMTTSAAADDDHRIKMTGTRAYAPTQSPLECPASNALIATPGGTAEVEEYLFVFDPRLLSVGQTGMPNAVVSADHKSVSIGGNGWTWVYTPSVVK